MKGFFLVRVPVRLDQLARWVGERGWVRRGNAHARLDRGRALHHLLTEVFGRQVLSPFRLMVPPRSSAGNLYAYSRKDGTELREAAANFAWPEHLSVLDAARITTKPMPNQWREGQRLGFDVQARPVRRVSRPIETRNGSVVGEKPGAGSTELDAFWLAVLRNPDAKIGRQDIYLDWLDEQLRKAAELDRVTSRLARFQRVCVARGNQMIEGPEAVFHGVLTVNDPTAFASLLRCGVGRHRAYGYGMLLLRPPKRAPVQV